MSRGVCFLFTLSAFLYLYGCFLTGAAGLPARSRSTPETQVQLIPLAGALDETGTAEISALAWLGDQLILLPQDPGYGMPRGSGRLYAIAREEITAFLDGEQTAVTPRALPFVSSGIEQAIDGFQGYEALVFHEGRVFLAIESKSAGAMKSFLVAGTVASGEVRLLPETLTAIPPQVDIDNMSFESLFIIDEKLVVLGEVNGANVNPCPSAYLYDLSPRLLEKIPFPPIEYRITDATEPEHGRFWTINYFYPGDREKLEPAPDHLVDAYGAGTTHARSEAVERLVEFVYDSDGIRRTDRAPIQLRLAGTPRNWEGIVRLEDRGLLIATDEYPRTMLAFVALPQPRR